MSEEKLLLETCALRKVYRTRELETVALDGVDFTMEAGEFTALAGPSGSGKTTLLNLLGALDSPTSGTVSLDGEDLSRLTPAALAELRLRRLGFVFQSYNLIPVFSAVENVEFVMELQGVDAKTRRVRALDILGEVGLEGLANKRPLEMSGGEQQRVAVARAIVSRPVLLLADEPSANLDSVTTQELVGLLKRLNTQFGTTILTATHDPNVMAFAARHIQLHDGAIESDDGKAEAA